MERKTSVLFGICGSFCNHQKILREIRLLAKRYALQFVLSEITAASSTRFFTREAFRHELEALSEADILDTIVESETIGPANAHDAMVIAPATANTISKLAYGIYDSSVTLAAKAMLRNDKPVLIGISTNDFIGVSGGNLLRLSAQKHIYLLPLYQDDPKSKPRSMTSCWQLLPQAIEAALREEQLQPIFREGKR